MGQRARLQPPGYVGDGGLLGRFRHFVHQHVAYRGVAAAKLKRHRWLLSCPPRIDSHHAVGLQDLAGNGEVAGEIHLNYVVHALPAGDVHNPGRNILGAVVDCVVGPRLSRDGGLVVGADGANDRGPGQFGFLDRVVAHCPGASRHQDYFPVNRPVGEEAAVSGHGRHAQAGALLESDGIGHPDRMTRGLDGVFRRRAEGASELGLEQPDPLSQSGLRHPRTQAVDYARPVLVGYYPGEGHGRCRAEATLPVRGVDSRCNHLDSDLAGARFRLGHLAHLHNFCGAVPFEPDCFHCWDLFLSYGYA